MSDQCLCPQFLPIECFPLIYYLNGFKFRFNRHLLSVGSFHTGFLCALIFFVPFSCNSIPHSGCSALHGVNTNWKIIIYGPHFRKIKFPEVWGDKKCIKMLKVTWEKRKSSIPRPFHIVKHKYFSAAFYPFFFLWLRNISTLPEHIWSALTANWSAIKRAS